MGDGAGFPFKASLGKKSYQDPILKSKSGVLITSVRLYLKNNKSKKGWRWDSRDRLLV
jgi:hypothetical protein